MHFCYINFKSWYNISDFIFHIFYSLLAKIEICLKDIFWTIILKKVSWTKLLSLSFLLWCLVLRLQPCMFIRRQEAFAET